MGGLLYLHPIAQAGVRIFPIITYLEAAKKKFSRLLENKRTAQQPYHQALLHSREGYRFEVGFAQRQDCRLDCQQDDDWAKS